MKRILFLCAVVVPLAITNVSVAQEGEGFITWIRHFTVDMQHSEQFVEMLKEVDGQVFDGMLAAGSIESWGIYEPFARTADSWTHAIWITAPNWAEIDDMVSRFEAIHAQYDEAEGAEVMRKFASMTDLSKMHDQIFRHVVRTEDDSAPSAQTPAYLTLSFYKVKPFQEEALTELYNTLAAPTYTELRSSGTVIGAGIARQEFVTTNDWTHVGWVMYPNLAAIDRMHEAFSAIEEARSERAQEKVERDVTQAIELQSYRSSIYHILHYAGE